MRLRAAAHCNPLILNAYLSVSLLGVFLHKIENQQPRKLAGAF
jgi:hypothetical protein